MEEEGFLEKLEKNYGIYLGVDSFIHDMNQKLDEIQKYSDLYRYIESDFGKNKTDLELIIEAYERAKKKGYIRETKSKINKRYKSKSQKRKRKYSSRSSSKERRDRSRSHS